MSKNSGKSSVLLIIGIVVTLLGALAAIGSSIWVTKSPTPLWALILVMWGVERVRHGKKPALSGTVLGLVYLFLGIIVIYLKDSSVLWAMILANWLIDYID